MRTTFSALGWIWLLAACGGAIDDPLARSPGHGSAAGSGAFPVGAGLPTGPAGQQPGAAPIQPGRVVAHRLNKVEYDNTIRDLFGVDLKPSGQFGFPDDTYIEGFDNNADSLSASPLLLEKYQLAADSVVARVLDPAPANAPVRARIMVCDPAKTSPNACANQILTAFATQAFRRPVLATEIAPYLTMLDTAAAVGDGFEPAIAAALKAMLLSPKFVFRVEANPAAGQVAPLSDYELASRLSYFIWSSMPDAALFQQAASQTLHGADELRRQITRMLKDPKAATFTDNMAGEWLGTRELAVKEITLTDVMFDDALRLAMEQEATLFIRELLTTDHPLTDILGSDFVFVNQRLAQHYGLPNAASLGADMQRIMVADPNRRGGVLSQANFLTVTSQRDRTSPTRRGKWVSENLLCVAIPPPPPKIPELVPNDQKMPTSTRERLEAHRRKGSTCNGCHQYMDPLGLAFEHYDAVGRWRETDLGAAIDATGAIPTTDVPFDGALGLASALKNDGRFVDCIIRKIFTYGLGRGLRLTAAPGSDIDDAAGLADVKTRLVAGVPTLSRLVELIAESPLMTMRTGEGI